MWFAREPGRKTMSGCDLSDADLDDVSFIAIDARNLRLPSNDDTVVVEHFPESVKRALAWVDSPAGDDLPDVGREALRQMLVFSQPEHLPPDASVWFDVADVRMPELPQLESGLRAALRAAQG